MLTPLSGIYAILDQELTRDLDELLREVLAAGVRLVQYRAKAGVDRAQVIRLNERVRTASAILILNDDLGSASYAGGVHLGQEDLALQNVKAIRGRLGRRVLGISCSTPQEAREAELIGADYLGVGPFNATSTKGDAGPAIGAAGIAAIVRATHLPVAAIGGIRLEDLTDVVAAGAKMAAVASAIAGARDHEAAARALVERWATLAPG